MTPRRQRPRPVALTGAGWCVLVLFVFFSAVIAAVHAQGHPVTASLTLAVENADLLRALLDLPNEPTISAVATQLGRDPSNVSKSVARLRREGLIRDGGLGLTDEGRALIPRLDVLEGRALPPSGYVTLHHDQIGPDPGNPRKTFDPDELDGLREEIVTRGALLQNLLVRPAGDDGLHMLVAGERRWRAIGLAIADDDLPADWPIPVKVEALDPAAARIAAIVENAQRVDVPPLEEAASFQRLLDEDGHTPTSIANLIGKSARHVQLRLKLLSLDEETQADLASGAISLAQARTMASSPRETMEPASAPQLAEPSRSPPPPNSAFRRSGSGVRDREGEPRRAPGPSREVVRAGVRRRPRELAPAAGCPAAGGSD